MYYCCFGVTQSEVSISVNKYSPLGVDFGMSSTCFLVVAFIKELVIHIQGEGGKKGKEGKDGSLGPQVIKA